MNKIYAGEHLHYDAPPRYYGELSYFPPIISLPIVPGPIQNIRRIFSVQICMNFQPLQGRILYINDFVVSLIDSSFGNASPGFITMPFVVSMRITLIGSGAVPTGKTSNAKMFLRHNCSPRRELPEQSHPYLLKTVFLSKSYMAHIQGKHSPQFLLSPNGYGVQLSSRYILRIQKYLHRLRHLHYHAIQVQPLK